MTNMVGYINKAGIALLSTVMRLLVAMVTTDASVSCTSAPSLYTDSSRQTLASLCCSLVPKNLITSLLDHIANDTVTFVLYINGLHFNSNVSSRPA